jgi:hypothetical protein
VVPAILFNCGPLITQHHVMHGMMIHEKSVRGKVTNVPWVTILHRKMHSWLYRKIYMEKSNTSNVPCVTTQQ